MSDRGSGGVLDEFVKSVIPGGTSPQKGIDSS